MDRTEPKTTQAVLGLACGVKQPTVSNWLKGQQPDAPNRDAIAEFFHIEPSELLARDFIERAERGRAQGVREQTPESSKPDETRVIGPIDYSGWKAHEVPPDEDARRLMELKHLDPVAAKAVSYVIAASHEKAKRSKKKAK